MAAAPRKLTSTETSTLRALLLKLLNVSGAQAEEDAGDLLDYAFAMIANGKDVDYVVDEVCLCAELSWPIVYVCDGSHLQIARGYLSLSLSLSAHIHIFI